MEISYFRIHSKLFEIIWPKEISQSILKEQLRVKSYLENEYAEGIKEIRMGFNTLSLRLIIDISDKECFELIEEIKIQPLKGFEYRSKTWRIPVCYDEIFGKDLNQLSKTHQIPVEEIVRLHYSSPYLLHFYGFLPGFMYLGGLDVRLHSPRKEKPERLIPAGTVAIGGKQTGIYPSDSPGGWYAIGKTPVNLFNIQQDPPCPAHIGDNIHFVPIDREEFYQIQKKVQSGQYHLKHD
ncbi:5-oxoprolinase subunit PxpB [Shivajiella indica]|uniref:5-oxoprolinase subunit PxpB n=1 Tax=Shivajiella indica TaxID=872115 RepID=A0ABW5B928_9BACT